MKKIKYPADTIKLEADYIAIFAQYKMQRKWSCARKILLTWSNNLDKKNVYPKKLTKLLTAKFEDLVKIFLDYQNIKSRKHGQADFVNFETRLMSLFHYSSAPKGSGLPAFQSQIADFFMQRADEMELHVCHYCETAYINTYKEPSIMDNFAHFLKTGDEKDVQQEITKENGEPISKTVLRTVMALRQTHEEDTIVDAFDKIVWWKNPIVPKSEKLKNSKFRNHFDLDHVLPKGECPLVGLSLYNFVPSCPICNERLKGESVLGGMSGWKMIKLSPSSNSYKFDDELMMQIVPAPLNLRVLDNSDQYHLEFMPQSSDYQELVRLFRLNDRYDYHKKEAFRLYDKLTDYPPARIKMLKNDFNGLKSEKEIEEDLFGMDFLKSQHRCFSKMLEDVFEQHKSV